MSIEQSDAIVRAQATREQRVADVLVQILIDAGVDVFFGLPGGTISPIHDALLDHPEVRSITTRHESGAMFAAAAYARRTGRLAVVLVTSGPGVINAMTGLASAHCDGLPVLLLAGEVPRKVFGKLALQEGSAYHLNIVAMVSSISKLALELSEPAAAPALLRRAVATAMSGRRGPVVVTLPLDVTTSFIAPSYIALDVSVATTIDEAAIRSVVQSLQQARRPVIFAGSGTRWGHGPRRLFELATRLQTPVMTTPKGKGVFPERHPLSLGVFGHGGHPSATRYLEDGVDLMLAVGTGLRDPATNNWSQLLRPRGPFIQIDAEALQLGRNYPIDVGLVGSAEGVLAHIIRRMPQRTAPDRRFGIEYHTDPASLSEGRIAPQRALWELQRAMPPETLYTCDIGEHLLFATHYLTVDDPHGFLIMNGLASMGSSIASAVGTCLATKRRPPIAAICGDGCFLMGLSDLSIAVKERVRILVFVLNDERYGMVELGHEALYGRTPAFPLDKIDVPQLARGVGARAVVVERPGQIGDSNLLEQLAAGPLVVDVRIDREAKMPKNARASGLSDKMKPRRVRVMN
jgi:acetolactate synthase-1/2/3 large subunit